MVPKKRPPAISAFWTMLCAPRETIRGIVRDKSGYQVSLLTVLLGVSLTLGQLALQRAGDGLPLVYILLIALLAGPFIGMLLVYIVSILLRWTGGWLGGKASRAQVRAAYVWGSLPGLWVLPLWIPKLMVFGKELFTSAIPITQANPVLLQTLLVFTAIEIIAGIWSVVLIVIAISEVHRLPVWKGGLSLLMCLIIIVMPYAIQRVLAAAVHFRPLSGS